MMTSILPLSAAPPIAALITDLPTRTPASYQRELNAHVDAENRMREALAEMRERLQQKDDALQFLEISNKESDHRLLNGLQLVVSLLSLQSRSSANSETASQLAAAANRVTMIERVHRRLHAQDGVPMFAFKQYMDDICRDFSTLLSSTATSERSVVFDGEDAILPGATGVPLGFIVNELITNAAKYGTGQIVVRLERQATAKYALSVRNDGPCLPDGYDPAASTGLGMKIIRSFVQRIGGELQFGRNDNNQGARFTVLFSLRVR